MKFCSKNLLIAVPGEQYDELTLSCELGSGGGAAGVIFGIIGVLAAVALGVFGFKKYKEK